MLQRQTKSGLTHAKAHASPLKIQLGNVWVANYFTLAVFPKQSAKQKFCPTASTSTYSLLSTTQVI